MAHEFVEKRTKGRESEVEFVFLLSDGQKRNETAEDASDCVARFKPPARRWLKSAQEASFRLGSAAYRISKISVWEKTRKGICLVGYAAIEVGSDSPAFPEALPKGAHLEGASASYEILDELGSGRSAVTYKAIVEKTRLERKNLRIGAFVTVKTPKIEPSLSDDEKKKRLKKCQN